MTMPHRKDFASDTEHQVKFNLWLKTGGFKGKVLNGAVREPEHLARAHACVDPCRSGSSRWPRSTRSRVLTMNAWVQKQGYPPFCKVVTQEDGLVILELIVDKVRGKEVPRVPAVSAFIEFCVGMMTGEVEKGGCRELRADPQLYATAAYGLSQAEMFMPVEKKGTFGWGP